MWCSKGQASPQRWRSSFFVDDPLPPEPKAGPDNISPGFSSDPIPFSRHNILVIHLASYWISSVASRLRYSITAVHLLYMLATKYLGFEMVFTPMCFSKDNLPPIHSLYLFLSHHTLSPASHTLPLPVFVSSHSLSPCCAPVNSFPPAWWTSCWWWLRIEVILGVILGIAHIDLLTNALGPPTLCWFLFLLLVISMMRLPLGWHFTCIDLLTSALGPQSLCWFLFLPLVSLPHACLAILLGTLTLTFFVVKMSASSLPLSAGSFPWTPTGCLHVLLYCCCEAHLRLSDSLHWCACLIKLLAKLPTPFSSIANHVTISLFWMNDCRVTRGGLELGCE